MSHLYGPQLEAEVAYRRERIAHDYAVAAGWSMAARRLRGRIVTALTEPTSGTAASEGCGAAAPRMRVAGR